MRLGLERRAARQGEKAWRYITQTGTCDLLWSAMTSFEKFMNPTRTRPAPFSPPKEGQDYGVCTERAQGAYSGLVIFSRTEVNQGSALIMLR